jgi:hypothetical protein
MKSKIAQIQYQDMYKDSSATNQKSYRLVIKDDLLLSALKTEFNSYFPFLKIEFFKAPHKIGEGSAKNLLYSDTRSIKDCRIRQVNGNYDFSDDLPVSTFEDRFLHEFGLSVQVFRKSGNIWLETSATDAWSLKQQNQEGKELSTEFK